MGHGSNYITASRKGRPLDVRFNGTFEVLLRLTAVDTPRRNGVGFFALSATFPNNRMGAEYNSVERNTHARLINPGLRPGLRTWPRPTAFRKSYTAGHHRKRRNL